MDDCKVNMTKKYNTIKELADIFWEFENKYNLVYFEIDGINIW